MTGRASQGPAAPQVSGAAGVRSALLYFPPAAGGLCWASVKGAASVRARPRLPGRGGAAGAPWAAGRAGRARGGGARREVPGQPGLCRGGSPALCLRLNRTKRRSPPWGSLRLRHSPRGAPPKTGRGGRRGGGVVVSRTSSHRLVVALHCRSARQKELHPAALMEIANSPRRTCTCASRGALRSYFLAPAVRCYKTVLPLRGIFKRKKWSVLLRNSVYNRRKS